MAASFSRRPALSTTSSGACLGESSAPSQEDAQIVSDVLDCQPILVCASDFGGFPGRASSGYPSTGPKSGKTRRQAPTWCGQSRTAGTAFDWTPRGRPPTTSKRLALGCGGAAVVRAGGTHLRGAIPTITFVASILKPAHPWTAGHRRHRRPRQNTAWAPSSSGSSRPTWSTQPRRNQPWNQHGSSCSSFGASSATTSTGYGGRCGRRSSASSKMARSGSRPTQVLVLLDLLQRLDYPDMDGVTDDLTNGFDMVGKVRGGANEPTAGTMTPSTSKESAGATGSMSAATPHPVEVRRTAAGRSRSRGWVGALTATTVDGLHRQRRRPVRPD